MDAAVTATGRHDGPLVEQCLPADALHARRAHRWLLHLVFIDEGHVRQEGSGDESGQETASAASGWSASLGYGGGSIHWLCLRVMDIKGKGQLWLEGASGPSFFFFCSSMVFR